MSSLTKELIDEIQRSPDEVQREVLDFLVFLKARRSLGNTGADDLLPLAQSAWAADWENPKEDDAWRDL
jgi:hypothetical protein